jgi:hypothetical protein
MSDFCFENTQSEEINKELEVVPDILQEPLQMEVDMSIPDDALMEIHIPPPSSVPYIKDSLPLPSKNKVSLFS